MSLFICSVNLSDDNKKVKKVTFSDNVQTMQIIERVFVLAV